MWLVFAAAVWVAVFAYVVWVRRDRRRYIQRLERKPGSALYRSRRAR